MVADLAGQKLAMNTMTHAATAAIYASSWSRPGVPITTAAWCHPCCRIP